MIYKTSFGKIAIVRILIVTIIIALFVGWQYSNLNNSKVVGPILTTIFCFLTFLIAFGIRPIDYVVTDDEIIIRRLFSNIHIKRIDIKSAEIIEEERIKGSVRNFRISGMFGYYGYLNKSSLDPFGWFLTRRDKIVLVRMVNYKKIIFTYPLHEPRVF